MSKFTFFVFKKYTENSRTAVYVDVCSCFRHLMLFLLFYCCCLLLLLPLVVVVVVLASAAGAFLAAAAAATALRTAGWSCSVFYFLF